MKFKKLITLGLTAVLSASLFVGCNSGDDTTEPDAPDDTAGAETATEEPASNIVTEITEPVEVVFWHSMSGDLEKSLQGLTAKFMEENPNITVTLQNQGGYNDLNQKLTATFISPKDLPTITQAYPDWMTNPINDDLIVDLTPFIENEVIAFDNYEDIVQGFRDVTSIDGKIYGIPFNKSTEVIWYNKTLFDELGLVAPTSYEELVSVSKTIFEKKGIAGAGFDSLSNYYTSFLKNEGITFDASTDVTGEASVKAVNYYLDGVKDGYFRIAGTDKYLSGPFAAGQVGMYIGSNAGESFVKQGVGDTFEVGVARYPAQNAMQQGTDIYMFSSASPEQQTASYMFLNFLASKENQITWATETGYIPARTSAVEDEAYKTSGSLVAPIVSEATAGLFTNPIAPGSDSAYRESASVLEGVLADPANADVAKALETYKSTLMSIWG